jgi:hypothetical protein
MKIDNSQRRSRRRLFPAAQFDGPEALAASSQRADFSASFLDAPRRKALQSIFHLTVAVFVTPAKPSFQPLTGEVQLHAPLMM